MVVIIQQRRIKDGGNGTVQQRQLEGWWSRVMAVTQPSCCYLRIGGHSYDHHDGDGVDNHNGS